MKKLITIDDLLRWGVCRYACRHACRDLDHLRAEFRKRAKNKQAFRVSSIPNLDISAADKVWLYLHEEIMTERQLRLFAVSCAKRELRMYERVQNNDKRVRNYIKITKRFLDGEATVAELERVSDTAARDAIRYADEATLYATARWNNRSDRAARVGEREWQVALIQDILGGKVK